MPEVQTLWHNLINILYPNKLTIYFYKKELRSFDSRCYFQEKIRLLVGLFFMQKFKIML
ncbi:MAG: hypothetical protein RL613_226 [Fusobacteriota bacterium]|jgi:hypothetical protein